MKKDNHYKKTTKAFCITVPKWLLPELDYQAMIKGRTRSSYIAWLIRRDMEKTLAENEN
jgi:metal-responsive CopG/Arc/MetJ family transcriptional regulator